MFSLPYIFQSFPSSAYSCLISTYFVLDVQCRGMLCKQFDWNKYGSYVRCINFFFFFFYYMVQVSVMRLFTVIILVIYTLVLISHIHN